MKTWRGGPDVGVVSAPWGKVVLIWYKSIFQIGPPTKVRGRGKGSTSFWTWWADEGHRPTVHNVRGSCHGCPGVRGVGHPNVLVILVYPHRS